MPIEPVVTIAAIDRLWREIVEHIGPDVRATTLSTLLEAYRDSMAADPFEIFESFDCDSVTGDIVRFVPARGVLDVFKRQAIEIERMARVAPRRLELVNA